MGKRTDGPIGRKPIVVDVNDIARRLGVAPGTVHAWRKRDYLRFPEPDWDLAVGPLWQWKRVREWDRRRKTRGDIEKQRRKKQSETRRRKNQERELAAWKRTPGFSPDRIEGQREGDRSSN